MKTIVCYGDSNTWGDPPGGEGRHPWEIRWPGALQNLLSDRYRVIEEGLNGRTTAFDDETSPLRNGLTYLAFVIESHSPIDILIIMLGTNDLKAQFSLSAREIAENAGKLIALSKSYGPNVKETLLISPPHVVPTENQEESTTFEGAIQKSRELAKHYKFFADRFHCRFLDAANIAKSSPVDGIHLDAKEHGALAEGIAQEIRKVFNNDRV